MWHDIAPDGEENYHHWHTKQHMVERLGHPGFNRSRRGVNWGLDRQRYLTLYEGDALETFVSDEYLASLNEPSTWTSEVAPHFRNFLRCTCQVAISTGKGVGGALATFRASLPAIFDEKALSNALHDHFDKLQAHPKISGLHLGYARPNYSDTPTRETQIRPAMREDGFDFVVVLESYGLREIEGLVTDVVSRLEGLGATEIISQSYDMAYTLEDGDLTAADNQRLEQPVAYASSSE